MTNEPPPPATSSRVSRLLLATVIGVVVLSYLSYSWKAIAPFDGPYADGPFQLFNALRRMDDGQRPGHDFPAFHGLGLPVLHYPVYALLGGDLIASELSRQLVGRFCSIVTYLLISWMFTRSLWPGVLWSAFFADLYPQKLKWTGVYFLQLGDDGPGNSILGLRSLVPLIFVAMVYRSKSGWRGALPLGFVLSLAFLFGVEQSFALVGGVLVTGLAALVVRWRHSNEVDGPPLLRSLVLGGVFTGIVLLLFAGERFFEVLRYFLVQIPTDQVWYFGVPPNAFLGDGSKYTKIMTILLGIFAVGCSSAWLVFMALAWRAAEPTRLRAVLATALGAGYAFITLTSNLGYLGHLAVPTRISLILGSVWAYWFVSRTPALARWRTGLSKSRWLQAGACAAVGIWAIWVVTNRLQMPGSARIAESLETQTSEFNRVIRAQCPEPKTGDLWSTYVGYLEAKLGIFHPDVDYIIHALSDDREAYIRRFTDGEPTFVQTVRRDTFVYEAWLESTTWGFYDRLLANYKVLGLSDHYLLWQRVDEPWVEPSQDWIPISLEAGQTQFTIPAGPADADIAVFQVEYEMANPLKSVPIFGAQGRILVAATGTKAPYEISLPPRKTLWEFPVFLNRGSPFTLDFAIKGYSAGTLTLKSLRVRYLNVPTANGAYLDPERYAKQLDDGAIAPAALPGEGNGSPPK